MGHVKYLQYGIKWSRLTNWDWKKNDLKNKMDEKLITLNFKP
jgi:hypothetical protein